MLRSSFPAATTWSSPSTWKPCARWRRCGWSITWRACRCRCRCRGSSPRRRSTSRTGSRPCAGCAHGRAAARGAPRPAGLAIRTIDHDVTEEVWVHPVLHRLVAAGPGTPPAAGAARRPCPDRRPTGRVPHLRSTSSATIRGIHWPARLAPAGSSSAIRPSCAPSHAMSCSRPLPTCSPMASSRRRWRSPPASPCRASPTTCRSQQP